MHPPLFRRFSSEAIASPERSEHASGVRVERHGNEISVELPFPGGDGVFYRIRPGELTLSSDMRLLCADDDSLDDMGVLSLLILGGCVPPLTPFSPIRAFIPGFGHRIHLIEGRVESHPATVWSDSNPKDRRLQTDEQVTLLRQVLDGAIEALSPGDDPIVLLSGGVDSAAIAARLVASGRSRTSLFHCSFGDDDAETESARVVASALGLDLQVVCWQEDLGWDVLTNVAARYPMPFADTACVPAMVLADGVAARARPGRKVFDGTGADACFGKWSRADRSAWLYALPQILRLGLGELYRSLNLYRRAGPAEKVLRLIRRSSHLGRLAFLAGQHPLAEIAVPTPPATLDRLSRLCEVWVEGVAREHDVQELFSLLYLGLACARVQCQKNRVLQESHGFAVAYPYMDPTVVDLAVSHARFWPGHQRPKNALRLLAAEALPPQIAFRPKRGFVPPLDRLMAHFNFVGHLDAVRSAKAPLSAYVDHAFIERSLDDLRSARALPPTTYAFLWGVAFCNAWLDQVAAESRRLRSKAAPAPS